MTPLTRRSSATEVRAVHRHRVQERRRGGAERGAGGLAGRRGGDGAVQGVDEEAGHARGGSPPAWPKEYGGAGMTIMEQFIFNEELADGSRAPAGRHRHHHGRPHDHRLRHRRAEDRSTCPPMLSGEAVWCQGFSEPGSGSDLASLQTRAVRDGDDYIVNGQKIWTTGAQYADRMILLARTDPDAPKHKGISYFLLDMKSPGVTVRPLIEHGRHPGLQRGVLRQRARAPRATSWARRTAAGTSAPPRSTSSAHRSAPRSRRTRRSRTW